MKVEKNRIGKEVAGGRGGKGGKKGGSSSGQITWPAEPPLYPNFLLEGDAAGIKGKRKSTSSNQGSISFPEMSFKEPAGSPILLKTKAEMVFRTQTSMRPILDGNHLFHIWRQQRTNMLAMIYH